MRKPFLLRRLLVWLSAITLCLIGLTPSGLFSGHLFAHGQKADSEYRLPVVEDWTHRHLIYSAPGSVIRNLELQQEPRYIQQYLRRGVLVRRPWPILRPPRGTNGLERDWGIPAGNGFTVGQG